MDATEGMRRIYLLAKRIMMFGPAVGALLWVCFYFWLGHESILELIVFLIAPVLLGACLWVLAWIVSGFVSPVRGS